MTVLLFIPTLFLRIQEICRMILHPADVNVIICPDIPATCRELTVEQVFPQSWCIYVKLQLLNVLAYDDKAVITHAEHPFVRKRLPYPADKLQDHIVRIIRTEHLRDAPYLIDIHSHKSNTAQILSASYIVYVTVPVKAFCLLIVGELKLLVLLQMSLIYLTSDKSSEVLHESYVSIVLLRIEHKYPAEQFIVHYDRDRIQWPYPAVTQHPCKFCFRIP